MSEHERMPAEQMFNIQQMVAAMTRTTCENDCGNCNVCHLSVALEYEKFMRRGDVRHINACSDSALRKVKRVEAERDIALATIERVKALTRHVIHTNNGAAQLIVLDDELRAALDTP